MRVGKECLLYSRTDNLGRWQSNVPKTIFPIQVRLKGFKGGDTGKGRGAPCRRSWCSGGYSYVDMTLNRFVGIIGSYSQMWLGLIFWESLILPSLRPVVYKSQGNKVSSAMDKGFRLASRECISLNQVNP